MKIYTLAYYSSYGTVIMGTYSSFENAKKALLKEINDCNETLDVCYIQEGYEIGYYPLLDDEANYEISFSYLDDKKEEENEDGNEEQDERTLEEELDTLIDFINTLIS